MKLRPTWPPLVLTLSATVDVMYATTGAVRLLQCSGKRDQQLGFVFGRFVYWSSGRRRRVAG